METLEPGLLRWLDLVAIVINLLLVVAIGIYAARRQCSADDYFLANRSMHGWVVGISMMATIVSSISFLAMPGFTFTSDWRFVPAHVLYFVPAIFAYFIFMPFFRGGQVRSAYEYLERRFGVWARLYGALAYTVNATFRIGLILYTISLPIQHMSGFPLPTIILIVGILISAYTIAGGLEAVIYTDVLQGALLFVGVAICLPIIAGLLPGGTSQIFTEAYADGKFAVGSTAFNLEEQTVWVIIITYQFLFLQYFASDQTVVQRYLAMKTDNDAKRGLFLGTAISLPVWVCLALIGTALYVLYKHFPATAVQTLEPDGIMPYFILTEVPAGLAGLIISALLAAAMSSIDSAINGGAATATNDFYRLLGGGAKDEQHYLKAGRWFSVAFSVIGICIALMIHFARTETIMEMMTVLFGLVAGGLFGLYVLGFFTERVGSRAALVATASTALMLILWSLMLTPFGKESFPVLAESLPNAIWIGVFPNLLLIILGYIGSYIFQPRKDRNIRDLTIWTKNADRSGAYK